jgi:hypothetical protein
MQQIGVLFHGCGGVGVTLCTVPHGCVRLLACLGPAARHFAGFAFVYMESESDGNRAIRHLDRWACLSGVPFPCSSHLGQLLGVVITACQLVQACCYGVCAMYACLLYRPSPERVLSTHAGCCMCA